MRRICVAGSINIDLVTSVERFPFRGETVTGKDFRIFPGGKGANQAVAAARLGAEVSFLGMIGSDLFADTALEALKSAGVNTDYIEVQEDVNTGIAVINVDDESENRIIHIPGANSRVDNDYISKNLSVIDESDLLLVQLEIPIETVLYIAEYARKKGKIVILDPAPAVELPDELIRNCSVITPNESEMKIIFGKKSEDEKNGMQVYLENHGGIIINKKGSSGAEIIKSDGNLVVDAFRVEAVDTTAAGDTFNGAFGTYYSRSFDLKTCVGYANAAAALSVTALGAQSAMPDEEQMNGFMKKYK